MSTDAQLLELFRSVFGDEVATLNDADGIDDVRGWDSAGHLNLIMAIEAEYGIQFDIDELESLTNVAAIRKRLSSL